MEELLVVAGVVALVVWWAHSGASPPQSQPTQAAVVQPATPAPPRNPRQRPRPKPLPGNSEVGRDLSEEACPASLGSARTEFTRRRPRRRRPGSLFPVDDPRVGKCRGPFPPAERVLSVSRRSTRQGGAWPLPTRATWLLRPENRRSSGFRTGTAASRGSVNSLRTKHESCFVSWTPDRLICPCRPISTGSIRRSAARSSMASGPAARHRRRRLGQDQHARPPRRAPVSAAPTRAGSCSSPSRAARPPR